MKGLGSQVEVISNNEGQPLCTSILSISGCAMHGVVLVTGSLSPFWLNGAFVSVWKACRAMAAIGPEELLRLRRAI